MRPIIQPTGVQQGTQRYGARYEGAPRIAQWRANLTALSQVHNLYFVAYASEIHVFAPQYPTQQVTGKAVLKFTSQPSAARLVGHLDPRRPHSINNLVVQYLGNEEVVAVVRDDGDCEVFLVRHIVQAIERRAQSSNTLPVHADEIRTFFQTNVGDSAWGLAIHASARILAISSNAHQVKVIKFGLLQTNDETLPEAEHTREPSDSEERSDDEESSRTTDKTYIFINGEANIPYISFCNTDDDPSGRWLLTTDINGICRIIDLQELKTAQVFQFGRLVRDRGWGSFDRINAGWILTFLDRKSFQHCEDVSDALGMEEGDMLPGLKRNPHVWDLSQTVKRLPGYAQPFVLHRPRRDPVPEVQRSADEAEPLSFSLEEDEWEDSSDENDGGVPLESETEMHDAPHEAEVDEGVPTHQSPIHPDQNPHDAEQATLQDSSSLATTEDVDSDEAEEPNTFIPSDLQPTTIIDDAADLSDEGTEDTISFNDWYNGDTITHNAPHFTNPNPDYEAYQYGTDLPCPILHASVRNIYLLQNSTQAAHVAPMVGLANPLRQNIQQDVDFLCHFQRLNMAAYIPPLGIVIVASQKGRAIVLALTKVKTTARGYPKETMIPPPSSKRNDPGTSYSPSSQSGGDRNKTIYAMRVSCILPSAQQEKANERPFAPLHGIAVAPLQQGEGPKGRWRLMMMYQDHSILSYEISRAGGGMDVGLEGGLEGLVV